MGRIVVLTMGAREAPQLGQIAALKDRFDVDVVEPRWPECQEALAAAVPDLVVVDGSQAPSHGRATAKWMANCAQFRTVPFLFLDVADKSVAKVRKEVPRAQFGTWASVVGVSGRLVKR